MKRRSEQEIRAANKPRDIFSMNLETIEQEKEEYLEAFKPREYRTIENFVITRKVLLLYNEAIVELNSNTKKIEYQTICVESKSGKKYKIRYNNSSSFRIGEMYVTEQYIIYIVEGQYEKYYKNYIEKTQHYSKPDKDIWEMVKYMLPNVERHFECTDGNFAIFVNKPCEMYSLREILEYFDGNLKAEYVASILTRLYYFSCYLGLVEITHNAITLDNIFFAPGRKVEKGESYTINDMRIVGVFGGWFFTTYFEEKIQGIPKEVNEIMPEECKKRGYSSFEVDELSIRSLAKELLGNEIKSAPEPFVDWVMSNKIAKDAYEEFCNWEKVRKSSFKVHRFVEMDISI